MLIPSLKNTKQSNSEIVKKAKTVNKNKQVKRGMGTSGVINQMITLANTKLSKYKDKYIIIRDIETLTKYRSKILEVGYCAIDTETTGLDVFTVDIVGVCLYVQGLQPAYIPLQHISYVTNIKSPNQLEISEIKLFFEGLDSIKWIMHNADYDIRILRHTLGVYVKCYWDTFLCAKVIDENQQTYKLKDLHLKFCDSEDDEALTFSNLFDGVTFDKVPIETAYLYASGDALKTWELYEYQKNILELEENKSLLNVFLTLEMQVVDVVCDMEDNGIAIDFDVANELLSKYSKLKENATENIQKVLSTYQTKVQNYIVKNPKCKLQNPINIASPTQLAILFYDILNLVSPDKNSKRGTGSNILTEFAKGEHKLLCESILEVRGYGKLLGTYIEKLPQLAERDGRIHCRFNQLGAKTTRFSSNDPNLQNIPSKNKEIRTMFKATDGYKLISADYSKQEIFIAASVSKDKAFIESCKNSLKNDTDIYSEIASMIYNVPYEECTEKKNSVLNSVGKERRGNAKNIVLAILYSKGVNSIATDLGVTVDKAQSIYNSVLKAFPKLEETIEQSQEQARTIGYVETAWGSRRHLPDMSLQPYEYSLNNPTPIDFDPMEFTDAEISLEVPKYKQDEYNRKLAKAYTKQKHAIKQQALSENIKIKDNNGFIADASRQCLNSRIQGTASNVTKVAMILINNDIELKELGLRLLIPIHDELIAEVPTENVERATERMVELMVKAGEENISVPMKVDVDITDNWNMT